MTKKTIMKGPCILLGNSKFKNSLYTLFNNTKNCFLMIKTFTPSEFEDDWKKGKNFTIASNNNQDFIN